MLPVGFEPTIAVDERPLRPALTFNNNYNISLIQLFNYSISLIQLFNCNISLIQLFNCNISLIQLFNYNIFLIQLFNYNISLIQLFNRNISLIQLFNRNISLIQLFNYIKSCFCGVTQTVFCRVGSVNFKTSFHFRLHSCSFSLISDVNDRSRS